MRKQDLQVSAGVPSNRRSFLKKSVAAAGAATIGVGLFGNKGSAFAGIEGSHGRLNKGDIAILRFLQALETIEADLWTQYAELGGAGANTPGTTGNLPWISHSRRLWLPSISPDFSSSTATCRSTLMTTPTMKLAMSPS